MLWVPQKQRQKVITNLATGATITPGTGVPSNATTLLDGAVTELISAANNIQDSWGINIHILDTAVASGVSDSALDILIGGATDDILISALLCGYAPAAAAGGIGLNYFFPIHIPAGVRIAAVLASVRTSITARVIVHLYGGSPPPFQIGRKVTTYGTQVNNARGQSCTSNTAGGFPIATQLTASSSEDHFCWMIGLSHGNNGAVSASRPIMAGVGLGADTCDIVGNWYYKGNASEELSGPFPALPGFHSAPAGTRVAAMLSNASTQTPFDCLVYAVS